jgi:ABC-type cobalamin transport system ATPase subunit
MNLLTWQRVKLFAVLLVITDKINMKYKNLILVEFW